MLLVELPLKLIAAPRLTPLLLTYCKEGITLIFAVAVKVSLEFKVPEILIGDKILWELTLSIVIERGLPEACAELSKLIRPSPKVRAKSKDLLNLLTFLRLPLRVACHLSILILYHGERSK